MAYTARKLLIPAVTSQDETCARKEKEVGLDTKPFMTNVFVSYFSIMKIKVGGLMRIRLQYFFFSKNITKLAIYSFYSTMQ